MTGWECLQIGLNVFLGAFAFVWEVFDVPTVEEHPSTVRVVLDHVYQIVDLIDAATIFGWPSCPLFAVDWAEITILCRPLIPDADSVFLKPIHIGVATEHPDQLIGNAFEVKLLGGEQWETFTKVVPELPPKYCFCAGTRSIPFDHPVGDHISQKV